VAHRLAFRQIHHYDPAAPGIPVPVTLRSGGESLSLLANVDTGSTVCIFRRDHAEALGLQLELGVRQRIRTATGAFETFGHLVSLSVLHMQFEALVYFAAGPEITRSVLGRQGFLDRVRLGLIDYNRNLYLSAYDDTP
jgi:hypothetical protein